MVLARKFKKQEDFSTKPVKEVWVYEIKTVYTIYYIYHIPYTIMQKSNQKIAILYCMGI